MMLKYAIFAGIPYSLGYNLNKVWCDGESVNAVVVADDGEEAPLPAFAGDCSEEGSSISKSVDGRTYTYRFNPYACNGVSPNPADVSSYNVDMEVSLGKGVETVVIGGTSIQFGGGSKIMFNAKCTFQSQYTASSTHAISTLDATVTSLGSAEYDLDFGMWHTNENYSEERDNTDYKTGEYIHHMVGLIADMDLPDGESNPLWNNFMMAPVRASVNDGAGFDVELYNVGQQTCGYEEIGFSATTNGDHDQWGLSYRGFTSVGEETGNLTFEVTVAFCHRSDSESTCWQAVTLCEGSRTAENGMPPP